MNKQIIKYLALPLLYILSVILLEVYPNVITLVAWIAAMFLCITGLVVVLFTKLLRKQKILLYFILLLPIFDLTLGISRIIRNTIKGEVVLNLIEDHSLTTKSLIIREKNEELHAEYSISHSGFGDLETGRVEILNDSTLLFNLIEKEYSEHLTYLKNTQTFVEKEKGISYKILENKLFK